jgi:hypothetical protein
MIQVRDIAKDKGCHETTVRTALAEGGLNGKKYGPVWLVYDDSRLQSWTPRPRGRPPKKG